MNSFKAFRVQKHVTKQFSKVVLYSNWVQSTPNSSNVAAALEIAPEFESINWEHDTGKNKFEREAEGLEMKIRRSITDWQKVLYCSKFWCRGTRWSQPPRRLASLSGNPCWFVPSRFRSEKTNSYREEEIKSNKKKLSKLNNFRAKT